MFYDLIEYPLEHPRLTWQGRFVVRDLLEKPHLFLRLTLRGTYFPNRALEPWVKVGDVVSRFARIADGGAQVNAYFDRPPPEHATVELGYGNRVFLRFVERFVFAGIARLERDRLPPAIHIPRGLMP
jgi:hypothetical protein